MRMPPSSWAKMPVICYTIHKECSIGIEGHTENVAYARKPVTAAGKDDRWSLLFSPSGRLELADKASR
jgi:hypothetical protein